MASTVQVTDGRPRRPALDSALTRIRASEGRAEVGERARGLRSRIAEAARGDIEAAIGGALRKSVTGQTNRALARLREQALATLEEIADGSDGRMPAAVLDDVLHGIQTILHPERIEAIAKRAGGPGRREAAPAGRELAGEELVQACVAIAKEFRALAEGGRKASRKLGAEDRFDVWEREYHGLLLEALRRRDLQTAAIVMGKAAHALSGLFDQARIDQAIGEPGEEKALIPNYRPMRR